MNLRIRSCLWRDSWRHGSCRAGPIPAGRPEPADEAREEANAIIVTGPPPVGIGCKDVPGLGHGLRRGMPLPRPGCSAPMISFSWPPGVDHVTGTADARRYPDQLRGQSTADARRGKAQASQWLVDGILKTNTAQINHNSRARCVRSESSRDRKARLYGPQRGSRAIVIQTLKPGDCGMVRRMTVRADRGTNNYLATGFVSVNPVGEGPQVCVLSGQSTRNVRRVFYRNRFSSAPIPKDRSDDQEVWGVFDGRFVAELGPRTPENRPEGALFRPDRRLDQFQTPRSTCPISPGVDRPFSKT